ncbi:hypothetical protein FRB97_005784, partial [Tulasnella sp. 331]
MYEVSTPQKYTNRVTTIYRLDSASGERTFAGEVEWKAIPTRTRARVGWQTCEWMLVKDWLENPKGWTSKERAFIGANGARYRWHRKWMQYRLTVDEDGDKDYLAVFREPKRNALLQITVMPSLQ